MAGIQKKRDRYFCTFRFQGQRYHFAIGEVSEDDARAKANHADKILALIEDGTLIVPEDCRIEDFVAAGGKPPKIAARPEIATARQLFDAYLKTHANGTIESNSLGTVKTHLNQIADSIGDRFRIQSLTLADLQAHVERRRKKGTAAVTLKKEIASLRACWNWAVHGGELNGNFPNRGLRFPKEKEKEPFRTFAEITAIIAKEKPNEDRTDQLWEALYLTRPELEEFLGFVKGNGTLPWVYPMVCFAAYTGARRSEILRSLLADVDQAGGTISIREKKRVRGKLSHRTAPITPKLAEVLKDWLAIRPDNSHLFCQAVKVTRSRTKRTEPTPITKDECHDHFRRTVADSKWEVMRGVHTLRHSFISTLAADGADQRVIDEIVGHQSEMQRKRYRHLYPKIMKDAVTRAFG